MPMPREPEFEGEEYMLAGHEPDATMPSAGLATSARQDNLRRVHRLTNWSLAALLVGVGATSATLAHVIPAQTTHIAYASTTTGGRATAAATSGHAPVVSAPVATSSGSQIVPASGTGSSVTAPSSGSSSPTGVSSGTTWRDS